MKPREAQKLRDTLLVVGMLMMLAGRFWGVFTLIGAIVAFSCLIPDHRYNRCPHCHKPLGLNTGKFCQHCGGNIEE